MRLLISGRVENLGDHLVSLLYDAGDQIVNLGESNRVAPFIRQIEGKFRKATDLAIVLCPLLAHFLGWVIFFCLLTVLANFLGRGSG